MPDYALELLHPGYFRRRPYRTLAGLYATQDAAMCAVNTYGAAWKPFMLTISTYQYQIGVEVRPFGVNGAWWRVTAENGALWENASEDHNALESPQKRALT